MRGPLAPVTQSTDYIPQGELVKKTGDKGRQDVIERQQFAISPFVELQLTLFALLFFSCDLGGHIPETACLCGTTWDPWSL